MVNGSEGQTLNVLAKSLQVVEKAIDNVNRSVSQLFNTAKGIGSSAIGGTSVGVSSVMNLPPVRYGRFPNEGAVGGEPDGSSIIKKPHFSMPSFTDFAGRAAGAVAGGIGIVALGSPSVKDAVQYRMVMSQAAFSMPGNGSLQTKRNVASGLVKDIGKLGTGISEQDLYISGAVLRSGGIGLTGTSARSVAFMSNMNPGIGAAEAAGLYNQLQSAKSTNILMSYGINTRDQRGRPRDAASIYEDYYQRISRTFQQRGGDIRNKTAFEQAVNTSLLPGGALALGTQNLFGDQAASVQNYIMQRIKTGKMNPSKKDLESVGLTTSDYNSVAKSSAAKLDQLTNSADSLAAGFRTMNGILGEVDKGFGALLKHIPGLGQLIGGGGTMMNSVLGGVAGGLMGRAATNIGGRVLGGLDGLAGRGAATAATTAASSSAATAATSAAATGAGEVGAVAVGGLAAGTVIAAGAAVMGYGAYTAITGPGKDRKKYRALLASNPEKALEEYRRIKMEVEAARRKYGSVSSSMVLPQINALRTMEGILKESKIYDDGVMGGEVNGTNTPSASSILKGLSSNANSVSMAAAAMGYKNQGGVAHRNINGTNVLSDHATGHAVDIMVPPKSADGYKLADYYLNNREKFGVKYLIWNNQFASAKTGWNWEPYSKHGPAANQKTATGRHEDHVHVSVTDAVSKATATSPSGAGAPAVAQKGLHQTVFSGSAGERLYGSGRSASAMATASPVAATGSYADMLAAAEKKYGLPTGLLYAQMMKESGGNPNARSGAGAMGLMQLMPATAKSLGVSNPFDPSQSIEAGARYLAENLRKFGSVDKALAAYNAGPGNVKKYGGIPPFKETQNYVRDILSNWQKQTTSRAVGGWNIPQDEFARLHQGEMVLPARIASAVRDALKGHSGGGSNTFRFEVVLTGTTEQQAMEFIKIVEDHLEHKEIMSKVRSN